MERQSKAVATVHWLNNFFLGSNILLFGWVLTANFAATTVIDELASGMTGDTPADAGGSFPWLPILMVLAAFIGFFKNRERPDTSFRIQVGIFCAVVATWVAQMMLAMKPLMKLLEI